MEAWNVVVTLREGGFVDALETLAELGVVARTDYYNVLAMKVEDVAAFPDALQALAEEHPLLEHWGLGLCQLRTASCFNPGSSWKPRPRRWR